MYAWESFDLINFEEYCKKQCINYNINNYFILIKTSVGSWMIELDESSNNLNLLHKNLFVKKNKKSHYGMEYHLQRKISLSNTKKPLMDIIEYIYTHDKDKYKKDYNKYVEKNKKIIKLFDKIN